MELNAYIDGELGPEEAAQLEARLEADEEERAAFLALTRQKRTLANALRELDTGPESLRTAGLERKLARALERSELARRRGLGGAWMLAATRTAAACALVAAGWWGHAVWIPGGSGVPEYVSEALGAHQVFAEDKIHPAEFTGPAVDSAAEWFSRKLGVKIAVPALEERGMQLVGARLLGTKEGPLAQFIYEDGLGKRLSLTVAKHPEDQPVQALKTVDYPGQKVGYWSSLNLDYALVSQDRAIDLQNLALELSKDI
ncbi:hypothetical protein DKT77_18220 [Meridianimarinicoccus roseus]|uniref:Anti-sigma factor RsiW n=1 Tax=Meridianimarinicoccus roseus TaxID=2072018 RepID=A0A2V2L6Y7_9RHOB|nr:anti-sigma factor [Meridianimarinicoccus roseus]PWR01100.1 hypothetical protein DKT77_18220 [Meridianimarinicoccus roseus]